jgi:hypothetical protein
MASVTVTCEQLPGPGSIMFDVLAPTRLVLGLISPLLKALARLKRRDREERSTTPNLSKYQSPERQGWFSARPLMRRSS